MLYLQVPIELSLEVWLPALQVGLAEVARLALEVKVRIEVEVGLEVGVGVANERQVRLGLMRTKRSLESDWVCDEEVNFEQNIQKDT